jgi:hypothetical protein
MNAQAPRLLRTEVGQWMGTDRRSRTSAQRLYDFRAAAIYLGRPVWGIRELVWSGELPVVRHTPRGKQWIDIEDLEDFIRRNKSKAR